MSFFMTFQLLFHFLPHFCYSIFYSLLYCSTPSLPLQLYVCLCLLFDDVSPSLRIMMFSVLKIAFVWKPCCKLLRSGSRLCFHAYTCTYVCLTQAIRDCGIIMHVYMHTHFTYNMPYLSLFFVNKTIVHLKFKLTTKHPYQNNERDT